MKKSILFRFSIVVSLVYSILLISCESGSAEDVPDEIIDGSRPKIEISNLSSLVETVTEISVNITDASSVNTTIKIDGIEVHTDSRKEFSFIIDPFEFPSGTRSIEITSMNAGLKESVTNLDVEFRRLLFRDQTFFSKENYFQGRRFISIHSMDGKLLEFKQINSTADATFYAPDDLEKQDVIVSRYEFGTNISNFVTVGSYTDIKMGTIVTEVQNSDSPDFFKKDGNFSFQANGIDDLVADNYNSAIVTVDPNNTNPYQLLYSDNHPKEFLITTSSLIEDPIENYKYLIIDDLSKTTYEIEDFKTAAENVLVDIPVDVNFRFNLRGYKNEDAFRDHHFNEIYDSRVASDKKVTVPVLEEFTIYESLFAYSYDRTDVTLFQKGVDNPLVAPKVEIVQNGTYVEFMDEYDYLNLTFADANFEDVVIWSFTSGYKQSFALPFYEFEIPDEVTALLAAKSLSLDLTTASSDFASLYCSLHKGGNYVYNKEQVFARPNNMSSQRDGFTFRRRLDLN